MLPHLDEDHEELVIEVRKEAGKPYEIEGTLGDQVLADQFATSNTRVALAALESLLRGATVSRFAWGLVADI